MKRNIYICLVVATFATALLLTGAQFGPDPQGAAPWCYWAENITCRIDPTDFNGKTTSVNTTCRYKGAEWTSLRTDDPLETGIVVAEAWRQKYTTLVTRDNMTVGSAMLFQIDEQFDGYGMEISLRLDCTSDQASISRWSAAKGCSQVCWRFDQAASLPARAALYSGQQAMVNNLLKPVPITKLCKVNAALNTTLSKLFGIEVADYNNQSNARAVFDMRTHTNFWVRGTAKWALKTDPTQMFWSARAYVRPVCTDTNVAVGSSVAAWPSHMNTRSNAKPWCSVASTYAGWGAINVTTQGCPPNMGLLIEEMPQTIDDSTNDAVSA
eukprot:CAMPEP_0202869604 /NCGR_PEP_ID=MMETSP1391-20130828/12545_1 /ASSEMBLY_ACC=CAM_ASM_000867 /TAXON_ID=1034604 /ORGANISM="Chlamydomonas leiostraca, Strain SAG 11-49" /LENGTH=324 /DNA_ID=CAMNT_0049549941 /DNA_START=15 /DNA_END=989 /DNA_ORIENTATION=+